MADSVGRRCWWCWKPWRRPSGWPSCCMTCLPCRSMRSPRSSAARPLRQGNSPAAPAGGCRARRRRMQISTGRNKIVDAFLAASREGDFEGLLAVLDPDVVFRADAAAQRLGSLGWNSRRGGRGRSLQGTRAGRQASAGRRYAGGRRHRRRSVAYRAAADHQRRADISSRGGSGGRTARRRST